MYGDARVGLDPHAVEVSKDPLQPRPGVWWCDSAAQTACVARTGSWVARTYWQFHSTTVGKPGVVVGRGASDLPVGKVWWVLELAVQR